MLSLQPTGLFDFAKSDKAVESVEIKNRGMNRMKKYAVCPVKLARPVTVLSKAYQVHPRCPLHSLRTLGEARALRVDDGASSMAASSSQFRWTAIGNEISRNHDAT